MKIICLFSHNTNQHKKTDRTPQKDMVFFKLSLKIGGQFTQTNKKNLHYKNKIYYFIPQFSMDFIICIFISF